MHRIRPSLARTLTRGSLAWLPVTALLAVSAPALAVPVGGGNGGGDNGGTVHENNWPVPGDGALPTSLQWLSSRADVAAFRHLATGSDKGASQTTYDIKLPPAILAPPLKLSYSSESALDTMMPYGWSLTGIMSITRPTARAYLFDERMLSGPGMSGTLKVDSRPAGAVHYHLASASQAHVKAIYTEATDSWVVTSKDGLTCTLAAASPSPTATWRATTCSDQTGNDYDIAYDSSYRLSTVTYGGNSVTGAPHRIRVAFTYAAATNAHSSFKNDFEDSYEGALSKITVRVRASAAASWQKIRDYELSLIERGGIQLLEKIREVGWDGSTSLAGPYTTYSYSTYNAASAGTWTGPSSIGEQTTFTSYIGSPINKTISTLVGSRLIDFNGDGLPDVVHGGSSSVGDDVWGVEYQQVDFDGDHSFGGTSRSFTGPAYGVSETTNDWLARKVRTISQTLDMNGDGFMDVVISDSSTTWEIWYGEGDGFDGPYSEPAPWTFSQSTHAPDAAAPEPSDMIKGLLDINGDGWVDCVYPEAGQVFYRNPWKGLGWDSSASGLGIARYYRQVDYDIETDPVDSGRDWIAGTKEVGGFHDLNGDGLPDYVTSHTGNWYVYFGTPSGIRPTSVAWPAPSASISVVEEGYPQVWVHVPCDAGDCGFHYEGRPSRQIQGLIDVDGDGYDDLFVGGDTKQWYRNLGDGFDTVARSAPSWWPSELELSNPYATSDYDPISNAHYSMSGSITEKAVMDLDRDAIPDAVIGGATPTVKAGTYSRPHLLIQVDNGRGAATTMEYTPSTDCSPAGQPYEDQKLSSLHHVVSSISTTDATSATGTAITSITYTRGEEEDGVFHGFGHRNVYQDVTGTSFYTTDPTSTQLIEYDLGRDHDPVVLSRKVYTDGNRNFSPSLDRGPVVSSLRLMEQYTYGTTFNTQRLPVALVRSEYGESGAAPKVIGMTWAYDPYGNLLSVQHDGGGNPNDAITVQYTYASSAGALIQRMATKTTSGYDPLSATSRVFEKTTWLHDGHGAALDTLTLGQLTGVRVAAGWTAGGETLGATNLDWSMVRGPRGELLSVSDVATGTTDTATYTFGSAVIATRTDALSHTTGYTIDDRGRVTDIADPNGAKQSYVLDALDRTTEEWRESRTGARNKTLDRMFVTSAVPTYVRTRKFTAAGAVESTAYAVLDGLGNALADWKQASSGSFLVTDSLHDKTGALVAQSRPLTVASFFTPLSRLGGSVTTASAAFVAYRDAFGFERESFTDYAAGIGPGTVTMDLPWVVRKLDAAGYQTDLTYDAHGRIIKVQQGTANDLVTTALYQYDPLHRLVKFVDGRAQTYTYSHDGAGRLRQSQGPDVGTLTSTYVGTRKVTQTDSAGGYAEWDYDAIGRPTQLVISDPVAPSGESVHEWVYDTSWIGKVTTSTDPSGQTTTTYDDLGRPTMLTRSYGSLGTPMVVLQSFDLHDRPTQTTFPFGASVSNTYSRGWLTTAATTTATASAASVAYSYNAFGLLSGWTNGTLTQSASYTVPLWPASLSLMNGATLLDQRTYTWAENGLLTSQKPGPFSIPKDYTYDSLQRVTAVKQGLSVLESYAYDAAGNLTSAKDTTGTWTYAAAATLGVVGNQVPKRTSAAGAVESFAYDLSGRLRKITSSAPLRTYKYDGLGRLRAVLDAGAYVEVLDRDADGAILRRENGSPFVGSPRYVYTFGGSQLDSGTSEKIDQLTRELAVVNNQRRWLFVDYDGHVGTVRDDAGATIGSRMLSAFGASSYSTGTPWNLAALHGLRIEPFTDLIPAGPRHLSRNAGQWLQPEPMLLLGIPADRLDHPTHFYAYRYSANSPTKLSDRSGYSGDGAQLVAAKPIASSDMVLPQEPAYDNEVGAEIATQALDDASTGAEHLCTRYVKNAIANSIGKGPLGIKGGDGRKTPGALANALAKDGRFLEIAVPDTATESLDSFDSWASQYEGAIVTMDHGNTYHSTVVTSPDSGHAAASDFKQDHVVPYSSGATNIRVFVPITPRGDEGQVTFQPPTPAQ